MSIRRDGPLVRSHSGRPIKQAIRIILGLDGPQFLIVRTIKRRLEVRLPEIRLVEIRPGLRRQRLQPGNVLVRHLVLQRDHVGRRSGPVPGRRDDGVDQRVAPGGQHRVGDVAGDRGRDVESHADEGGAIGRDGAVRGGELGVVGLHDRPGNQPAAVLRDADLDRALHGLELRQVAVELRRVGGIRDPQPGQSVGERPDQLPQLGDRDIRPRQRRDGEAGVGEIPDTHGAGVDDGRQRRMVQRNRLVERILRDAGIGKRQVQARHRRPRVRLGRHRPDHPVGAAAAAAQRPVQIRVLVVAVGHEEIALSVNHLPLEDLVGRQSVPGRQRRVPAALGIAAGQSDGRTLAADDLEAVRVGGPVRLDALHAGAHLDRLALVVLVGPVLDLDVLEVVRPDRQSAGPRGLAVVVVTGVADNHADVVFRGELHGRAYVLGSAHVDRVDHVVAQRAGLRDRVERVAGAVGEEGGHDRRGRFIACFVSFESNKKKKKKKKEDIDVLYLRKLPLCLERLACGSIVVGRMAGSA